MSSVVYENSIRAGTSRSPKILSGGKKRSAVYTTKKKCPKGYTKTGLVLRSGKHKGEYRCKLKSKKRKLLSGGAQTRSAAKAAAKKTPSKSKAAAKKTPSKKGKKRSKADRCRSCPKSSCGKGKKKKGKLSNCAKSKADCKGKGRLKGSPRKSKSGKSSSCCKKSKKKKKANKSVGKKRKASRARYTSNGTAPAGYTPTGNVIKSGKHKGNKRCRKIKKKSKK